MTLTAMFMLMHLWCGLYIKIYQRKPNALPRMRVARPSGLIHTGRARKLEHFSFDVACVQCEHSY